MKKIIFIITTILLIMTACGREQKEKSSRGFYYAQDTICNGHLYLYDNTGMMDHPECPKCEQRLKRIITEVIDSINNVRDEAIIENLNKEKTNVIHIYN